MNHIKLKELKNKILHKLIGRTGNFNLNASYLCSFQNLKYQTLNVKYTEKIKSKNRHLP